MKSKKYITLTTILWIALVQTCPSAIHASVHFIEYVKGGIHPSMAINSQGHIHLSYYLSNLDYGRWDGISWSFEDVDMDSTSPRGKYSSICLDARQEPHIVYPGRIKGTSSYQLMHAAKIGSTWQLTEVDVVDNGIHQISADITTAGQIWASWAAFPYLDKSYHELRYSHFDGNSWTTGLIDNENYSGNNNSLSIDPITQYPKVTYSVTIGSSGDKLKYAEWNGTSWTKETIDSGCFISAPYNSMDIDSVGNVHVAYVDEDNNLKYASRINGAWNISTIDTGALWSTQVRLKLDQGDNPHIVYRKFCEFGLGFSLIYANLGQSNTWKFARIIECPNPTSSTVRFDLALDPDSNVHIIFVDNAGPSGGGLYHMVILRTYYVDADAPAGGNGSSWAGAFNHLQDALAVAEAGDEIRVAQGVYTPEGPMPDIHQASNPNPADGATGVSRMADLSWTPGYDATSHDVYFGTTSPGMFQGNQTATTFDPCTMDYSTTYYWRIVELGNWGKTVGTVWSFTTGEMLPPPPPPPPPPFGSSNEDESIEPAVDRTATFQLVNGVVIKGGYAGFGEPNADARDIDKYKTILSGDLNGDDVEVNDPCDLLTEPSRAENSYHVVSGSECNKSAVLDGFTITAGNANREGYPFHQGSGGGIQIRFGEMREVGPVLKNCTFIGNSARWGGGVDNDHCSTTLTNCTFSENFAEWGGGIGIAGYAGPKLVNCTFTANRAGYKGGAVANGEGRFTLENCALIANHAELGGAIYNGEAGAILTNCTLIGNSAESGGAVYNKSDSSVRMTNCLVSENSCTEEGGVVYLRSEDSATLINCILTANSAEKGGVLYAGDDSYARLANCIVTGNWATDNGGALYFDGPDGAKITNCILWSDTPQEIYPDLLGYEIVITYNDVQGGWPGQGNIDVDPCFFDAGYWDANGVWIDGNYHLLQTSACINAGDNNSLPIDIQDLDGDSNTTEPIPYDLDGNPRIIYDVVDMGAYEFDNTAPIADAGPDQIIECACNTKEGTKVTLHGTNSSDPDYGVLTYTWTGPFLEGPVEGATPTVTLDGGYPGEYVITLVVNDGIDDSEPDEVVINVVDTKPPEFEFSVSPTMMWPPNHKMVEITPSWTVSDICDQDPNVSLVSIVANEGDDIIGDGHTGSDIQIGDDGSIFVRSERSGTNTGRIYTITYQAVDDCGNAAVRSATVSIPHDFKMLARIASRWLWAGLAGSRIPEDLNGDGIVNLADFARFANNWIK